MEISMEDKYQICCEYYTEKNDARCFITGIFCWLPK